MIDIRLIPEPISSSKIGVVHWGHDTDSWVVSHPIMGDLFTCRGGGGGG